MLLEYSGPYLAMLEYASALKLTIFSALIGSILFPHLLLTTTSGWLGLVFAFIGFIGKIIISMALLALLESAIAKMRFYRMQEYLSAAFFIALAGMIIALFISLV
jgi:formate hydrogenlyase subunit 4